MQPFTPAATYDALRIQAVALYARTVALQDQALYWRTKAMDCEGRLASVDKDAVDAERDTNAHLTDVLAQSEGVAAFWRDCTRLILSEMRATDRFQLYRDHPSIATLFPESEL